jgi:aspartyl-tRNA(Asn)/glutamyl-tRNA(Gln) amidotransferase subunit A
LTRFRDFETIRAELASGATTCEKLTADYLKRIDDNGHLNAFLTLFPDEALERARSIDRKIAAGTAGQLAGLVIAVKDIISMKGKRLTCASRMLESFESLYDATVVEKLNAADAVIVGKTNMDEFAMGSSNENSAFGPVLHHMDNSRVPGGSSGGSAVAVAAGLSTAALGSDTGGSVRQPAAFVGIVGLKPTYGRVSRYGLVAFASSFDHIGTFSATVRDAALMLETIAGHDPHDATSAAVPVPQFTDALTGNVNGVRVGVPEEYFADGLDPEISESIEKRIAVLRSHGAVVKKIRLTHSEYTIAAYYVLATAEASSNLARYDGARYGHRAKGVRSLAEMYAKSRSEGFGSEVKRRIMLGTFVLSAGYYEAYYRKAQKVRRLIKEDFDRAFSEVDCIITPTSPTTAFRLREKIEDPLMMYLSDIYTVPANLAGIPALSLPSGIDRQGLPMGLQILGKQFDESTILRVADLLERAAA